MSVYDALAHVSTFQEVHVEHPGVTRRSSVAVVIRYPGRKLRPGSAQQVLAQIKQLDATDSPEILFIKRAASERDRWSSHIALPGGRRDPEDKSDLDAAIRETSEEVGVDLIKEGVCIGPLDQFLVKVQWGTRVIMTLCPFVFVLTNPDAQVVPQPTEIATAFWHPIKDVVDERNRCAEYASVGNRLGLETFLPSWLSQTISAFLGKMQFQAIVLNPSPDRLIYDSSHAHQVTKPPYRLWGLTLGYMTDFFELMGPGMGVDRFRYPTMTHWDSKLIIHLLSYRLKKKRREAIKRSSVQGYSGGNMDLVSKLLDGYFVYVRRGVLLTLGMRFIIILSIAYKLLRK